MAEMTVSAALRRIKKLKGAIAERTSRAQAAAVYEDTKVPAFEFKVSINERIALVRELIVLQTAVAISNATTKLASGMLVAQAIRTLEETKGEIDFLKQLPLRAKLSTVDVEEDYEWNPNMTGKVRVERKKTWVSAMTQAERAIALEVLTDKFEKINNEVEARNNQVTITVTVEAK